MELMNISHSDNGINEYKHLINEYKHRNIRYSWHIVNTQ